MAPRPLTRLGRLPSLGRLPLASRRRPRSFLNPPKRAKRRCLSASRFSRQGRPKDARRGPVSTDPCQQAAPRAPSGSVQRPHKPGPVACWRRVPKFGFVAPKSCQSRGPHSALAQTTFGQHATMDVERARQRTATKGGRERPAPLGRVPCSYALIRAAREGPNEVERCLERAAARKAPCEPSLTLHKKVRR